MSLVNVPVNDSFILLDNSNNPLTGKIAANFSAIEAYLLPTGAITAAVTLTEVGLGEYAITFTPSQIGTWVAHVEYNSGGVFRNFISDNHEISSSSSGSIVAISGTTASRGNLRRRIADQLGDYVSLEATDNAASTSSFIDTLNINTGSEDYNGRQLIFTSGPDAGSVVRITGTTETSNQIAFTPAVTTPPAAGTTADVVNERARGYTVPEYHRAIQNAIKDAYPLGVTSVQYIYDPTAYSPAPAFNVLTLTIATPPTLMEVHTVEWLDTAGDFHPIPKAPNGYTPGWRGQNTTGQLEIRGAYGRAADAMQVRVSGYARYDDNLASDTDATDLNEEWIVARSCYHLCRQALDRDASRGTSVQLYLRESEMLKTRIRTVRRQGTMRIRGD